MENSNSCKYKLNAEYYYFLLEAFSASTSREIVVFLAYNCQNKLVQDTCIFKIKNLNI